MYDVMLLLSAHLERWEEGREAREVAAREAATKEASAKVARYISYKSGHFSNKYTWYSRPIPQ